jgi:hypothetical protein
MGAWDIGIFDNDTSADVRAFYEQYLREDEATATARVLEKFAEDLDEPEVAPDIWFGLAGTQWELGRLDPEVAGRALAIIDSGEDVERWRILDAAEEDVRARGEALQAFAAQLRSAPPPPSPLLPPPPATPRFAVGDVLTYRLPSGSFVVLCVIAMQAGDPVCAFMPQALPELPDYETAMTMDIAEDPYTPAPEGTIRGWMLLLAGEPGERMQAIGHIEIKFVLDGHLERLTWAELAAYLERHCGLR